MPASSAVVTMAVSIGGSELSDTMQARLAMLLVEDELSLPDVARVEFDDPAGDVLATIRAQIGKPLKIEVDNGGTRRPSTIFEGEITALEIDVFNERQRAVVRGMDKTNTMHVGRRTEVYLDSKISDAVSTAARRHGLSVGNSGSLNWVEPSIVQWNETDWEFVSRLAREFGHTVSIDATGKLDFAPAEPASSGPGAGTADSHTAMQLVAGVNLLRVKAMMTAGEQVAEVEVRGWDPKQKREVVASANVRKATTHDSGVDPTALAKRGSKLVRTDIPYLSQEPAAAAAKGIAEQIGAVAAEIECVTFGHPDLRAGAVVSIAGVGDPFDGNHTLTSCRHTWDRNQAYTTEIRSAGTQRRGLLGLTGGGASSSNRDVAGVVTAVVSDIEDPDGSGRVKLSFPWLDDAAESPWCRVMSVGGGPDRGIVFSPEVGDEVLVAFQYGDVRRPYVIGGLHNGRDKRPLDAELTQGQDVEKRVIVSRTNHRVVFDDKENDVLLSVGDDSLQIDMNGNDTTILISSEGKIEITSKQDMTLTSDGNVTIESKGKLALKGTQGVDVDGGGGNFEAKGVSAKVTGSASFEASAPQAKLAGQAMTEITGGLVKIN